MPHYMDERGGVHYLDSQEWVGLLPEGFREISGEEYAAMRAPTLAESAASAIAAIKGEAGARILARYPQWKQANMTAAAVELIAAGKANGADWDKLRAAWAWIQSVRSASDRIEAAILAAPDVAGVEAAVSGAQWPA